MINELKIQELKDMFFYTFGIVPLQNYNVVGDGMTDNRLQIQQAIYDAIEVGASYIFVPKGNYYYSNQLFKKDEVTFIGNNIDSEIKDVKIKTFPEMWSLPIGSVIELAGNTIPSGYLECNGQTFSKTDYPELHSILNSTTLPTLSTSSIKKIIKAK